MIKMPKSTPSRVPPDSPNPEGYGGAPNAPYKSDRSPVRIDKWPEDKPAEDFCSTKGNYGAGMDK